MTGPANGTLSPSASRFTVAHKSPVPLHETYTYSVPGGHWSAELKFAGYDGLVVRGKSAKQVYLWIDDGKVELRSAELLWGMTLSQLTLAVEKLHGWQARVLGIGPAGENLCRQAPAIVDFEHATGISGAGAVMGSKNLKAIVVRGTGAVAVARPKELIDLWYYYFRLLNRKPGEEEFPNIVKSATYYMYHSQHIPHCPGHPKIPRDPAVYFKNNGLDDPISLMREPVEKGLVKLKWGGCYACPVCCALAYQSTDPNIPSGSGQCNDMQSWPTWEWAGYKKVVGIPSIWYNRWCDDLGLSTTNAPGYHFYWFFELVEMGILTKENTGLPLDEPWTLEFIRGALEKLAYRQGKLFDQMAEGQERFLKNLSEENPAVLDVFNRVVYQKGGYYIHWGDKATRPNSTTAAIIAATETRANQNKVSGGFGKSGMLLAGLSADAQNELLKLASRRFLGSEQAQDIPGEPMTWKDKVMGAIVFQHYSMNMDCVTMCGWANQPPFFSRYTPDKLGDPAQGAKVFSAVTGIDMTNEQMLEAMSPIINIERSIQVREGRRRDHDVYSDAVFESETWNWTSKEEFAMVMDDYYAARGWDPQTGIPRRSTLEKQGLKKIADELETKYGVSVPE
ncbi:MAG: aldehyde ferredoxin oxidoreductase N-terminal domain-containing protein, partial [Dehalococcoidia bacterium]|nr:aldehyde ferredoxin oxidoreductase N-terminal domain-containing protein [Dehalococcoidia bacterium]